MNRTQPRTFLTIPEMRQLREAGLDTSDAKYQMIPLEVKDILDPEAECYFKWREEPDIMCDPAFFVYSMADVIWKLEAVPEDIARAAKENPEDILAGLFSALLEKCQKDLGPVPSIPFEKEHKNSIPVDSSIYY